jgi:hypothetical protein
MFYSLFNFPYIRNQLQDQMRDQEKNISTFRYFKLRLAAVSKHNMNVVKNQNENLHNFNFIFFAIRAGSDVARKL